MITWQEGGSSELCSGVSDLSLRRPTVPLTPFASFHPPGLSSKTTYWASQEVSFTILSLLSSIFRGSCTTHQNVHFPLPPSTRQSPMWDLVFCPQLHTECVRECPAQGHRQTLAMSSGPRTVRLFPGELQRQKQREPGSYWELLSQSGLGPYLTV